MRRIFYALLLFSFLVAHVEARTSPRGRSSNRKGSAAAYGAFDATALSMVIWGTGMAVVIATAAILIPSSTGDGENGNGGNGHAHQ